MSLRGAQMESVLNLTVFSYTVHSYARGAPVTSIPDLTVLYCYQF